MKDFILAIDGGQTSTVCLIGLTDGTILSSGLGGPACLAHLQDSEDRMATALSESITRALTSLSPRPQRVTASYLSLTGGVGLAQQILPSIIPSQKILAESDVIAALASGTLGGPGVGLIAGTGVVAIAQKSDGSRTIKGGWGYLIGDEGGGYWIGIQALRAAAQAADGRGPDSPLFDLIFRQVGVKDTREATAKIYADEITRPDVADLCPLVNSMADENDPVALAILDEAANHLLSLVIAICKVASFEHGPERVLVATGGVLRHCNRVRERFSQGVRQQLAGYTLIFPHFPPIVGAFILGLRLAGITPDKDILSKMENSLKHVPTNHLLKQRDGISQKCLFDGRGG